MPRAGAYLRLSTLASSSSVSCFRFTRKRESSCIRRLLLFKTDPLTLGSVLI